MTTDPTLATQAAALIEALPQLLRQTREARGLSMRYVADVLGCGVATVHDIEHDFHSPSATLAARILRWIGGEA